MMNAISAGHRLTLNVAKEILLDGGNAFDAGVAAHFAMFITEPCMASAGGGGYALARTSNKNHFFFDFFCQTPSSKNLDQIDYEPITVDFGTEKETFYVGLASSAVPGTIAGLFEIHRRFGTIPIGVLMQPAMQLAKDGVVIDSFQEKDLTLLAEILGRESRGKKLFFNQNGILGEGDLLKMPGMYDFLNYLSDEGQHGFYKGEISKLIHQNALDRGGYLQRQDFEKYQVAVLDPFLIPYADHSILVPNGPGKGGLAMALFLADFSVNKSIPKAIRFAHNLIKNLSQAQSVLNRLYPKNNFAAVSTIDGLSGTSHFTINDKMNNTLSLTTTIGEGSGYFIPGTDMQLNNMLGETFLLPNGPHSWLLNSRMNSMMTPTMVTNSANELVFAGGSGGASRIPFAIGQVLLGLLDAGLDLEAASRRGRFHFQDGFFQVEHGAEWSSAEANTIFWDKSSLYFGGVHAIHLKDSTIAAQGDHRRNGVSTVFE